MIESSEKLRKIVGIFFIASIGIEELEENAPLATITLYYGYDWEEIKFTEAAYEEPASQTNNGTIYLQKLEILLAGDDSTTQAKLLALETSKPVFRFDYDSGDSKIIGDKENYCKVTSGNDSKDWITKNDITISRSSSSRAFFLTS